MYNDFSLFKFKMSHPQPPNQRRDMNFLLTIPKIPCTNKNFLYICELLKPNQVNSKIYMPQLIMNKDLNDSFSPCN